MKIKLIESSYYTEVELPKNLKLNPKAGDSYLTVWKQIHYQKSNVKINVNEDGTVDIIGGSFSANLVNAGSEGYIPFYFNVVTENFTISSNNIVSLEGSPKIVGGRYVVSGNLLTDILYSPEEVGSFSCGSQGIKSLKGFPKKVKNDIDVGYTEISKLEYLPKEIDGDFYCSSSELTSLEGTPTKVGGNFNCSGNHIEFLQGCPEHINKTFDCSHNNLLSLKGCPKTVDGDFYCNDNQMFFDERYVEKHCTVRGRIHNKPFLEMIGDEFNEN